MQFLIKYFPQLDSVELEFKKNGLLRILFGIVIIARYSQILITRGYTIDYPNFAPNLIDIILFATLLCFTIGLFTSISTLLTIFFLSNYDESLYTQTLATSISIQFLIVLFFSNCGAHYSMDASIARAKGSLAALIRKINSFPGSPDVSQLTLIYFFGFLSYGLVSLFALSYHFQDQYWVHGDTVSLLLTGSYTSKYYQEFRNFSFLHPTALLYISKIAGVGQSIFQLLMIPLIFVKHGRTFVFWWGFMFFLTSLLLLQLSYLPHVEILLWLSLFGRTRVKNKIEVLYDGKCNLCKRAISILKLLNYNESIVFTSLWDAETLIEKHNLDGEKIKVWMGGIRKEKVYFGYDLYIEIAKLNPFYYVLLPLLYIGKWTGIGYRIYALIARNRYKLMGQCELVPANIQEPATHKYNKYTYKIISILYITCFVLFFFFKFPYLEGVKNSVLGLLPKARAQKTETTMSSALWHLGMDVPDVFNETDLKLNEKWFVLYRIINNKKELVPILDEHGGRLRFYNGRGILKLITGTFKFHNHGSDILYFGTILVYRRSLIHLDVKQYHKVGQEGYNIIRKIALMDKEKHKLPDNIQYYFEVRKDQSVSGYSDDKNSNPNRFKSKVLYTGMIAL